MSVGVPRRPRGLPTKRELADLAANSPINQPAEPLDLVHVTPVGWGRRIIGTARIETRRCPTFEHDLVYTFVARPAYRFRDGDLKSDQISRFPFVLVLSPEKLGSPYHVYPFDTGAFAAGLYSEAADPTIFLEEYELPPSIVGALQHIAWAFGSKPAYFEGTAKADLTESLPHWCTVGRGWIDIAGLASIGRNRPDARAAAIEVGVQQVCRFEAAPCTLGDLSAAIHRRRSRQQRRIPYAVEFARPGPQDIQLAPQRDP